MKHQARVERHAPPGARVLLAAPILVAGAVVAVAGRLVGGLAGLAVTAPALAVTVVGTALCWRTALVVEAGELLVRNPVRAKRLAPSDVVELRPERLAGLLGPLGTMVGVVRPGGAVVRVAATLSVPGADRGTTRAALFLTLWRWASAHDVPDRLPRHEFAVATTRRDLLGGGEEVEVRCRMRRTDARGWGDWATGRMMIPAVGLGQRSTWVPDASEGTLARPRPVGLEGTDKVAERSVRFPEEAFFGKGTGFLVITMVRRTLELAFPDGEAKLVLTRLRQLERHDGVSSANAGEGS